MLRDLPLFRRVSRLMLYCRDRRIFLRVFSPNTESGVWELKKTGCVFEGGYVFRPPDGRIVGTYRDIRLIRLPGLSKKNCNF